MTVKKIIQIMAVVFFIFGLTACGASVKTYTANQSVPVAVPAPPATK